MRTRCLPVKAWPPACSIKNDMGKTSYRTLQFLKLTTYKDLYLCKHLKLHIDNTEKEFVSIGIPEFSSWALLVCRVQKYASI
jgi:hypothetical protein